MIAKQIATITSRPTRSHLPNVKRLSAGVRRIIKAHSNREPLIKNLSRLKVKPSGVHGFVAVAFGANSRAEQISRTEHRLAFVR